MSATTTAKRTRIIRVALAALFAVVSITGVVRAQTTDELNQKAAELQRQIAEGTAKVGELSAQADTLQRKLNELNGQIASVNSAIQATDKKIADLNKKLDDTVKELDRQKALLRASMKQLYVTGDVSTIEMLANSNNFSEFVNEQKYLEQLKTGVQNSTKRVIALKQEIEDQKAEQEKLKQQQEAQRRQLASAQDEQSMLLDQTKGDEARYQTLVASLRAQQAAVNAQLAAQLGGGDLSAGIPCGGGYPAVYCNAAQDTIVDRWLMYNRECVSYTAFRVWASGRGDAARGFGNANMWPDSARSRGIPVDTNPRVGDVAISMAGTYGHAMYVEAVNGNGTIFVSQYNFDFRGTYSTMTIRTSGLYFIHF